MKRILKRIENAKRAPTQIQNAFSVVNRPLSLFLKKGNSNCRLGRIASWLCQKDSCYKSYTDDYRSESEICFPLHSEFE